MATNRHIDPNTTLTEIRALVTEFYRLTSEEYIAEDNGIDEEIQNQIELVARFEELDAWLSGGGTAPKPWRIWVDR